MKNRQAIKRPVVWQVMFLLTVCFMIGCYSLPGGSLYPQKGEGYTVVKTDKDEDAAQIVFGETIVQIEGSWSEWRTDIIGNTYTIENNSAMPFSFDFTRLKLEVQQEETTGTTIIDITDLSTYDNKAFAPAKIYNEYYDIAEGKTIRVGTKKVVCPPKQKGIFSLYASSDAKLNRDKSVKVTLPAMTGETRETVVVFNLRRDSIWSSLTARVN